MPIDPSIVMGLKPARVESPLNRMAQVLQVRGMQDDQALKALQADEVRRGIAETQAFNDAYKNAVGPDGTVDRNKLFNVLATGGMGSKIPGVQKQFTEADSAEATLKKTKFETAEKGYKLFQTTLGSQFNNPNLNKQEVLNSVSALVEAGAFDRNIAAKLVQALPDDPQQLRMALRQVISSQMTPEQMLTAFAPKPTAVDDGQRKFFTDTNPNSPTYGQNTGGAPVQKVATPEAVLSSQTTMRGQNMTDTRAREFNAIQQDANNIKRSEKREVQDLTKNSQIASMDTMLGTLDRLSAHPGLSRSVGVTGAFPTMPGSNSANFQAELNTFQSQAFIPMVAQLKGMGALSDAEGKKLTAAVGALDPRMGEEAFRSSVARIIEDMEAARERLAGARRTPKAPNTTPGPVSGKVIDFGSLK